MSLQIQLKKSAVSQKQPFASDLAVGELALNYHADGPFLTCKDTAGNVRKLNHVWVGTTAPSSPSAGDQWLDTTSTPVLKIYNGSTWVSSVSVPLATTSAYGTVRLATTADVTNGTAGKLVDAAQLASRVTTDIASALAADPFIVPTLSVTGNATVTGNLTVNGTQTIINTQTLDVEDRNIVLGNVSSPTDATANTGGITLKGATDKTFSWLDATDSWTSSENVDLASGKSYRINGTEVLSSTALGSGVTDSSLTSVGTIGTGVWEGSAIVDTYLATISTAGKVSNSATTATNTNTASAIVARDSSGDFSAGTITATLSGNAATATKLSSTRTFALTGDVTGTVASDLTSGASITAAIGSGVIIDADVNASAGIALSKLANVSATDKLLGRSSAGAGAIEEIACTAAGRALLDDADAAAQRSTLGLVIGTDVQAYDADTAKLDVVQTFTAVQTLTDPAIIGTILEDVYTISDGAAFEIDPGNGSVQLITLGDNRTPKATNFAAGEAVTLMVDDGTAYALTWTDATFGGSGVVWKTDAGSAPTLNTSGYTAIVLWKVGSQVYGARVGDA